MVGASAWRIILRQILPNVTGADPGRRDAQHRQRDPARKLHQLPRIRHPAAAGELGQHAHQRSERLFGRSLARRHAGACDHACRDELQLHRRRASRRARSEDAAGDERLAARLLAVEDLTVAFGRTKAVDRCLLHARTRRNAWPCRRERMRQVRHGDGAHAAASGRGPSGGARVVRRRGPRRRSPSSGCARSVARRSA